MRLTARIATGRGRAQQQIEPLAALSSVIEAATAAHFYLYPLVENLRQVQRYVQTGIGTNPAAPFNSFSHVDANWWRQGMTGSALARYEGIKAFSETDQTEDLKAITVPALVLQGDDDQVVPYKDAAIKQHELLQNSEIKIYEGYPHGMLTTHADVVNPDILAFIQK